VFQRITGEEVTACKPACCILRHLKANQPIGIAIYGKNTKDERTDQNWKIRWILFNG
jgi:hypothetical protein